MIILNVLLTLHLLNIVASLYPFQVQSQISNRIQLSINWDWDDLRQSVSFYVEYLLNEHDEAAVKWLSFGFTDHGSNTNNIESSDHCLVELGAKPVLKDIWVNELGDVVIDEKQDCNNALYEQLPDGRHVIKFTRKADTCDLMDYRIEEGTTQLVAIVSLTFELNINSDKVLSKVIPQRLQQVNVAPTPLPYGTMSLSLLHDNITIPSKVTTYWCATFRLPQSLQNKHHIVKYAPVINAANAHIVHHMEVYACAPTFDRQPPSYNGECLEGNMPARVRNCKKVIAAWAMGASPMVYPAEAGLPFGGPDFYPYLMLEVHYNNELQESGRIDNSGLNLYYTAHLRQHDAGILETGSIYSDAMAIPPGQDAFSLIGYCTPECTAEGFPTNGITIIASQLHAHGTGRRLSTMVARNGRYIKSLNWNNHYTPHWQEIRPNYERVKVYPGDTLVTRCVDDTSQKDFVTLGGYGIDDEMCVNYIHYYPLSKLEVCKTAVANSSLHQWFRNVPGIAHKMPNAQAYRQIHWSQALADSLANLYSRAPLNVECLHHDGKSMLPRHRSSKMPLPSIAMRPYPELYPPERMLSVKCLEDGQQGNLFQMI